MDYIMFRVRCPLQCAGKSVFFLLPDKAVKSGWLVHFCVHCSVSSVLLSLALPSLWITPVKISISGLMYVTGVAVTGVTFLMDNTSEDQYIRSYVCHWCYCHWRYLPYG